MIKKFYFFVGINTSLDTNSAVTALVCSFAVLSIVPSKCGIFQETGIFIPIQPYIKNAVTHNRNPIFFILIFN